MVMIVFVFVLLSCPVCTTVIMVMVVMMVTVMTIMIKNIIYDYSNAYFEPVSLDKIFVDVVNETTAWLSTVHHTSQTESEKKLCFW